MGTLFGIQNMFTQIGMSVGPFFGSFIAKELGYIWAFNVNGIFVLALFVAVLFAYPYDQPVAGLAD